jgi:hypothetical protein
MSFIVHFFTNNLLTKKRAIMTRFLGANFRVKSLDPIHLTSDCFQQIISADLCLILRKMNTLLGYLDFQR